MRFPALLLILLTVWPAAAQVQRFELDNGLRIILLPAPAAQQTALLTLFSIGERHDPPGASGMAHLMEHLFITAAAGDVEARTAESWMQAYAPPQGACNAQTGEDYTVIATAFAPDQLEEELAELAARMQSLRITGSDLSRELPRLDDELQNMFERFPALAAMNQARERLRPSGENFRKGGLIEHLRKVDPAQAQRFADRHYKPGNARIVIVGSFDPAVLEKSIRSSFAQIPRGEPPPPPRHLAFVPAPEELQLEVHPPAWQKGGPGIIVTRAFATPAPDSEHYPAFLVHLSRLFTKASSPRGIPAVPPVQYALLEDPHVLYLSAAASDEAAVGQADAAIRAMLEQATREKASRPRDVNRAISQLGWMLGAEESLQLMANFNPYGVAFSLGRADMRSLNWDATREKMQALTREQMEAAAEAIFAEGRSARVVIRTKPE